MAFTLVEVAIALGLMSFVLLGIIGLLGVGLDAGKAAHIDSAQATAAQQTLSFVRTNDFDAFSSPATYYFDYDGTALATTNDAYFECVVSTRAVTDVPPAAAANLEALKVEFRYPLSAPDAARTTNVLHATFARHD